MKKQIVYSILCNQFKNIYIIRFFWIFTGPTGIGSRVNNRFLGSINFLINEFLLNPNSLETYQSVEPLIECYMKKISETRLYTVTEFTGLTARLDRV